MSALPSQPIADRYEVISVAGAGAMGIVYRARDRVTGKDVAVKTIRDGTPNAVARFQREGALLPELVDHGIVRWYAPEARRPDDREGR